MRTTLFLLLSLFLPAAPVAADGAPDFESAQISGDPERPRRHFRVKNPGTLTPAGAEAIYRFLEPDRGYRVSGHPVASEYPSWRRYNIGPYRSATHGRRFVNNYANDRARAYGDAERAEPLPPGSVIAKDSFTVTMDGEAHPGPLFLMEKMPAGFNYVSGDWRYTMIMPDGSVFGTTGGAGAERVEYCVPCHLARQDNDHLFFVPPEFRVD